MRLSILHIGFTGTREGLKPMQLDSLFMYVNLLTTKIVNPEFVNDRIVFHHGDCVGADAEFHNLLRKYFDSTSYIVIHPQIDSSLRAWCKGDFMHDPKPYLKRNEYIVQCTQMLLACPKEMRNPGKGGT